VPQKRITAFSFLGSCVLARIHYIRLVSQSIANCFASTARRPRRAQNSACRWFHKGCGRPLSVLPVEPHAGVNSMFEGSRDIADSLGLGVSLHPGAGLIRLADHRTDVGHGRPITMSDDRRCDYGGFGAPQPRNIQKIGLPRRQSLSDPISGMLAAWIVVFCVAAVGLLLLYSRGDPTRDRLVLSRWHAPPVAVAAEWSDPECHPAVQSCLNLPAEDDSTDAVRALVER
jgi:hypothetical protein